MQVISVDGQQYVSYEDIKAEWNRIEQYISLLTEMGKGLHIEAHVASKIEEIQGHPVV